MENMADRAIHIAFMIINTNENTMNICLIPVRCGSGGCEQPAAAHKGGKLLLAQS
jgi:hypothetical protein